MVDQQPQETSDVFNEGAVISAKKYPKFNQFMNELQQEEDERSEMTVGEQIQCLAEAIEWQFDKVDQLELEDKDIFIPLGPSRTGKGTLLAALQGFKMKIFKKRQVKDTEVGKSARLMTFMAPCDPNDDKMPIMNAIMSHQHNSHTIYPKIPDPPHVAQNFQYWDNTYLLDFPGMFDCRGILLDIPMELALQRILQKSKSARLVVLVSASILLPDNARLITEIKNKLESMFKEPQNHVVIAITKAQMFASQMDEDDIVDIAQGEDGQNVSFRGYTVVLVSQDKPDTIQEMLDKIKEKDCIKDHVKMGFFDHSDLQKMLESVQVSRRQERDQGNQIALELTPILNKASLDGEESIRNVFERVFGNFKVMAQRGKLEDEMQDSILKDMNTILNYQLKMNECWNSFRSPMEVKSIIGLIDEFKYTNTILENEKYDNPSINYAFYDQDMRHLDSLSSVMLIVMDKHIEEIKTLIQMLVQNEFLKQEDATKYLEDCDKIKEQTDFDLDNMGIDPIKREQQFGLFVQIVGAPIILLGTLAVGIRDLAGAIGNIFKFKEKEKMAAFKKQVQLDFKSYIELEIQTAQTSIKTKHERQERCRAIATFQKEKKDMTQQEYDAQLTQVNDEELSIAMMNLRYKNVCHKISCQPIIKTRRKFNILSIDGGGIRAYMALVFLIELEIKFKKNVSTMFDMVGGTGFGGLVAAALNTASHVNKNKPKYSTTEIINFFKKKQKVIFKEFFKLTTVYSSLKSVHRKIGDVTGQLYDGNGLQESLKELFSPFRKMKDLMKPTVITAYQYSATESKPILITSDHPEYSNWDISEALLAACSSPYFFPPLDLGKEGDNPVKICDGGVSVMNPTELMVQKAIEMGYAIDEIYVLSLGTGEFPADGDVTDEAKVSEQLYWPIKYQKVVNQDTLPSQQVKQVDKKMKETLPQKNYIRIQIEMPDDVAPIGLDSNSAESLMNMGKWACSNLYQNEHKMSQIYENLFK